jgi:subtilisin family serine protease
LLANVNDPLFSLSWSHSSVQATRAWDASVGSSAITVAVIDTGFTLNHEDLSSRWVINTGEYGLTQQGDICWTGNPTDKASNNCDDDSNNYRDDWRGYDFYNNDNSPQAGQVNPSGDGTRHGSMVAGVIGAAANNGLGSTGIDQQARIMPLQVFSDNAEAYTSDIVAAIDYATDNGARIINLSLGTNIFDSVLLTAIQRARNNGVLVIAASGNCALNDEPICTTLPTPGRMTYPALYTESFAVGATTSSGERASYSSYGSQLDIVAPGSNIGPLPLYASGGHINQYGYASGTSFSAPLVAGIASLLLAQNQDMTPRQLEYILTESATKHSSMNNQIYTTTMGAGNVNAHKATLLSLARSQDSILGSRDLSPSEQAHGALWRTNTNAVAADEWILVGCRVSSGAICSVTVTNGQVYRFTTANNVKGDELQFIFIQGSQVPAGVWSIAVHNNEYGTNVTSLTK